MSSILTQACLRADIDTVKSILKDYEEIPPSWSYLSYDNLSYDNPLRAACEGGSFEIFKLLIDKGLTLDSHPPEIIRSAARGGSVDILHYLAQHGFDLYIEDNYPLKLCAYNGHLSAVKYLVTHGADIHAGWEDPFFEAACSGNVELVQYLIYKGARFWYRLGDDDMARYSDNVKDFLAHFQSLLRRHNIHYDDLEHGYVVLTLR